MVWFEKGRKRTIEKKTSKKRKHDPRERRSLYKPPTQRGEAVRDTTVEKTQKKSNNPTQVRMIDCHPRFNTTN